MLTVNGNAAEEMVMGEVPMMTPCEQAEPPVHESVVVASVPKLEAPVQYARLPAVGIEVVENWLERVMEAPRATEPPPESPLPALIVTEELSSRHC